MGSVGVSAEIKLKAHIKDKEAKSFKIFFKKENKKIVHIQISYPKSLGNAMLPTGSHPAYVPSNSKTVSVPRPKYPQYSSCSQSGSPDVVAPDRCTMAAQTGSCSHTAQRDGVVVLVLWRRCGLWMSCSTRRRTSRLPCSCCLDSLSRRRRWGFRDGRVGRSIADTVYEE